MKALGSLLRLGMIGLIWVALFPPLLCVGVITSTYREVRDRWTGNK